MSLDTATFDPTTYEADTNEVFVSRIPFECSSVSGKVVRIERILKRGEYMVLRTRAATNDAGAVTSCNYSKILGPMFVSDHWYPRDHVSFQSMIFNPEPNDPNLEADLRSNLATRGYGSWYPTGDFEIWLQDWYDNQYTWHEPEMLLDGTSHTERYFSMRKWRGIMRRYSETRELCVKVRSLSEGSCRLRFEYVAANGGCHVHDFADQMISSWKR